MTRSELLSLIERLLMAHAPSGHEAEVDAVVLEEFERRCDAVYQDEGDNLIAHIKGVSAEGAIGVTGHKDEIGMIVKRIDDDGRLHVRNVGGSRPWIYGEGVVDVLGDKGVVSGILSAGARHVSEESREVFGAKTDRPLTWEMVWVETKRTQEELEALGVHIGSKAVVGRHRKRPFILSNGSPEREYLCGYGLDCKVAVAILIAVLQDLTQTSPPVDVYLIASAAEEVGVLGAAYAARTLPIETLIAVEVGPVAPEYQTQNTGDPIVLYQDAHALYDEGINDRFARIAGSLGFSVQRACVASFGSDASYTKAYGSIGRAACLCYPTENTHGYEISSITGIENTIRLLSGYLSTSP
jgi:putative aminopeptidase FrvX